jgi:hypothetical protein
MRLHSPRFEKILRREIKKAVRSSPALKKEYRRVNKAVRSRRRPDWLVGAILALAAGFVVWLFTSLTGHPATGLAVINLMTLFLAAQYAEDLPKFLFRASDLPALSLLPLPEPEVFRWELQKFFRKAGVISLIAMLAAYGGLGIYLHLSTAKWIVNFILAVVSWAMLFGLSTFFATRFPRLPYQVFTGTAYMFGFVLLITWKEIGKPILHFIDQIGPELNLILPTGWCPSLFQLILPGGQWMMIGLIIPVIMVILTLKKSLELLRARFTFTEHVSPEIPDQIPGKDEISLEPHGPHASQSPVRLGPTAIEEIVQTRQFLIREPWERRGWIEGLLWHTLDEREKTLGEFAFPTGISISRPWKLILRNFSMAVLAGFLAGLVDVRFEPWMIGIGLVITSIHALALILGNGSGFRPILSSGIQIPLYAAYPITFRELSTMLFKVSAIQLPFFVAYALVSAVLISYLTWTPFNWGIFVGFKLALLIFSGRFITTTMGFSACTNDTARFRLRTIALVVSFLGFTGLFLAMGAASLFVPNPYLAWLFWVVAIANAYGLFRVYGWFHGASQFDLMSVRR